MVNRRGIILIGCGRIGKRHAEHIVAKAKLVAVCDIDFERANALSVLYNVPCYTDYEKLYSDGLVADLVAICTPNGLHFKHTCAALESGYHVLCEKPMAINCNDALKMISKAENLGKRLFVVKQNRYNPAVLKVKDWLDQKVLGEIYSFHLSGIWNRNKNYYQSEWRGTQDLDGGILYTQFSHFIDLVYWFFGDLVGVCSIGKKQKNRVEINFPDSIVVAGEFELGIIGSMHFSINAFERNMEGALTIVAEKGTVKIGGQYLNRLEYQKIKGLPEVVVPIGNLANDYGDYTGSMSNHDLVYTNVLKALNLETTTSSNVEGADAFGTIKMIEDIQNKLL